MLPTELGVARLVLGLSMIGCDVRLRLCEQETEVIDRAGLADARRSVRHALVIRYRMHRLTKSENAWIAGVAMR